MPATEKLSDIRYLPASANAPQLFDMQKLPEAPGVKVSGIFFFRRDLHRRRQRLEGAQLGDTIQNPLI